MFYMFFLYFVELYFRLKSFNSVFENCITCNSTGNKYSHLLPQERFSNLKKNWLPVQKTPAKCNNSDYSIMVHLASELHMIFIF